MECFKYRHKKTKMCPNELPKHFECNGEDISDTPIIANKFNTFFATIGTNLANALPAVEGASIGDYMGEHNINSMFLTPVVENEIISIVKLCKPKNSKDCNDISMYVISKVIISIAKPLAHIFNLSFSCGVFPDHMKIAKIIPIFKNGQKTEFTNYRPISILSQFSKILKKLFNLRLEKFLDANKILSDSQYGFRSGMSTDHAAAELVEQIASAIDGQRCCAGVFIDLKKAFDTVDHELLVEKLKVYGIRDVANKWLQNYLTNRKQYVVIDDHSSDMLDMTCGIPQGSVLGPILFIIYINDICNVSDVVKCVLFADDTNIFCSEKNDTDLQLTLNRELGKLFVWFSVNKLSLNLSKTNYILFCNRSADTDLNICINTINVTRVQSSKFLGIIIDENLNWKPHIQLVKSKLSKTLSIIYKASKLINCEGMFTLYCSLFLPYLTYCCEIWGNTYTTNVNCLYVIQKKLVRIIHHEGRLAHTNCLFQQMHSLKFHDLVKYRTAIIMFKLYYGKLPTLLQSRFMRSENIHNTRSKNTFILRYSRTNLKAMSISVCGIKLWNALPVNIKETKSLYTFKIKVKAYLLSYYNDYNY